MDPEMTLGALGQISPPPTRRSEWVVGMPPRGKRLRHSQTLTAGMKMRLMTLKVQKWLILFEQVIGHCSMGIMANHTVFHHRGMFEYKRPLFIRMAVEAKIVETLAGLQVLDHRPVMLMAAAAFHFPFS